MIFHLLLSLTHRLRRPKFLRMTLTTRPTTPLVMNRMLTMNIPLKGPRLTLDTNNMPTGGRRHIIGVIPQTTVTNNTLMLTPRQVLHLNVTVNQTSPAPKGRPRRVITEKRNILRRTTFLLSSHRHRVEQRTPNLLRLRHIFVPIKMLTMSTTGITLIPQQHNQATNRRNRNRRCYRGPSIRGSLG